MIAAFITSAILFGFLVAAATKWELKQRHYLPWSILMTLLGGCIMFFATKTMPNIPTIAFAIPVFILAGVASVGAIMFFFFRDPERNPPKRDDVIVSPADGTVVYIKDVLDGKFPFAVKNDNKIPLSEFAQADLIPDRGIQIGIAMNYLNVHVNRAPIAGTVKMVKAIPGKFSSLKHIHSLLENERALVVFENEHLKVGIVQIASRIVRRIISYVQEGEALEQGQRIGMIKFGSQVDLLIGYRDDLKVRVAVGDEVVAGESILISCASQAQRETDANVTELAAATR